MDWPLLLVVVLPPNHEPTPTPPQTELVAVDSVRGPGSGEFFQDTP
jgi:hypothetical protein